VRRQRLKIRLIAAGVVIAFLLAVLFFGLGVNHQKSARTGAEESSSLSAPTKVEAASVSEPAPIGPRRREHLPAPAQAAVVSDVDPHKAFGSRTALITMEVLRTFSVRFVNSCLRPPTRRWIDNYEYQQRLSGAPRFSAADACLFASGARRTWLRVWARRSWPSRSCLTTRRSGSSRVMWTARWLRFSRLPR
jgi:hypothetical protein